MNWNEIEQSIKADAKQLMHKYSSNSVATESETSLQLTTTTDHLFDKSADHFYSSQINQKINELELTFQNKCLLIENLSLSHNESKLKIMKLENDLMKELHQSMSQQQLSYQIKLDNISRQYDQISQSVDEHSQVFVEKSIYSNDYKTMHALLLDVKRESLSSLGLIEAFANVFHELKKDPFLYMNLNQESSAIDFLSLSSGNGGNPQSSNIYLREATKLKYNIVHGIRSAVTQESANQSTKLSSTVSLALENMTNGMQSLLQDVTTKYALLHQHVFELESKLNDLQYYKIENTAIQDSLFKLTQSLQEQHTNQFHIFSEKTKCLEETLKQVDDDSVQFQDKQQVDIDDLKKYYLSHKISLAAQSNRIYELECTILEQGPTISKSAVFPSMKSTVSDPPNKVQPDSNTPTLSSLTTQITYMEKEIGSLKAMLGAGNLQSLQHQKRMHAAESELANSHVAMSKQIHDQDKTIQSLQNAVEILTKRLDEFSNSHTESTAVDVTALNCESKEIRGKSEPVLSKTAEPKSPYTTPLRKMKLNVRHRISGSNAATAKSHIPSHKQEKTNDTILHHRNEENNSHNELSQRMLLDLTHTVQNFQDENDDMKKVAIDIFNKLEKIESFADARDLAVQELRADFKVLNHSQTQRNQMSPTPSLSKLEIMALIEDKLEQNKSTEATESLKASQKNIHHLETTVGSFHNTLKNLDMLSKSNESSIKHLESAWKLHQTNFQSVEMASKSNTVQIKSLQQSQEVLSDDVDELKRISASTTAAISMYATKISAARANEISKQTSTDQTGVTHIRDVALKSPLVNSPQQHTIDISRVEPKADTSHISLEASFTYPDDGQ